MSPLQQIVWVLTSISTFLAKPFQLVEHSQQAFSLRTDRLRPLWRNDSLRLNTRNPDAVSFHVDPSHNYAWTPVLLGRMALLPDFYGRLLTQNELQLRDSA